MDEDLRPDKAALRRRVLALRAAQPLGLAAARSVAAQAALLVLPAWKEARCVLLFWAMPGEVDTAGLVLAALAAGKVLVLPRISKEPGRRGWLQLHRVRAEAGADQAAVAAGLVPGTWGILEPSADAPVVDPAAVDLAVVPGVAFDRAGRRLGYGGGFYDALLPHLRAGVAAVGLAFALQVVEWVPAGPRDVTVAGIATEDGVYWTGK